MSRTLTFRLTLFAAAAVFSGLVSSIGPATATHFSGATGATNCTNLNMADNADHVYAYIDLQAETTAAMNWTRTNNMNPTHINTSHPDDNPSSLTDVLVRDRYYEDYCGFAWYTPQSGGIVGLVVCDSLVSGHSDCEQHTLRMSNDFTDNTTLSNQRGLACHENGHTVGLGHRGQSTNDCMHQDYPKNANAYDAHDVDAINSHY